MLEILELTDRIIADCQKVQYLVRIELLKRSMEAAGDLSAYFWTTLNQLKIDRTDPKVLETIEKVLIEMGFTDQQGKPSTKKFENARQVQDAITGILETLRISQVGREP